MDWFWATWALYRRVFTRAAILALKNWPVLLTAFVYSGLTTVAAWLAVWLGMFGGILISLVFAACVSSFLHLVEVMIHSGKVNLVDFRRSFGMYLWDVVGVSFLSWIYFTFVVPIVASLPQGPALVMCLNIAMFVFFNAVPELIYLGQMHLLDLFVQSYRFISTNWVEWLPANVAGAALFVVLWNLPFPPPLSWIPLLVSPLLAYFFMVMRGLLFIELQSSSQRGRIFRYRAGYR
ncbi:MAG: hypothetical protein KatS3mg077_1432 [Candidatus Binatia bacterium]|nr:MAG: hypothetical protein KatS3mg077_1432 [Candidatus Binatia bacterium]